MAERLALFGSGGGTTIGEVLRAMTDRRISPNKIVPAVVIVSKPDIGAIDRARNFGIPFEIVNPQDFKGADGEIDREGLGQANKRALEKHGATVATLNGYTPIVSQIEIDYLGHDAIYNQHPADPRLFGQLYGKQTHAAVLDFSDNVDRRLVTMATAHRVTQDVDRGAIVVYETIPVPKEYDSDILTIDSEGRFKQRVAALQALVLPREHAKQILLVSQIGDHTVRVMEPPKVVFDDEKAQLARSKARAVQLFPLG